MKVGDLVKNVHSVYPDVWGIILEISKPQLTNPNACPYKVQWFDKLKPRWMNEQWLEVISENRRFGKVS